MIFRFALLALALASFLASGKALAGDPAGEAKAEEHADQSPRRGEEEAKDEEKEEEDESEYKVAPSGHRYRVRFDPASRISVTAAAAALHDGQGNVTATFETGFSFSYRKLYRSGTLDGRVFWQVDHQLVSGSVRPFLRPAGGIPSFDATLYRATLLRHSESPSIVLPLSPPLTVGFPFDVGLDAELMRVTVPVLPVTLPGSPGALPWLHLGVVRSTFTLDPWRSGQPGRSLALGVGARYDVDVYTTGTGRPTQFVHRVAPLTSGSVRFRYQTDDGLLWLDAFAEAAPHWTSDNKWGFLASGSLRLDRTLIAVNDQPVSAFADVGYRYLPEGRGAPALHDVHATLGIAASLSLK